MQIVLYVIQKKNVMCCEDICKYLHKGKPFSDHCYPGIKTKLCVPNVSVNG